MAQLAKRQEPSRGMGRAERALQDHEAFLAGSKLARSQSGVRESVDAERRRGRGATINPSGRFEPISRHVFDDGWQTIDELPPFKTEVQVEKPRTIITRNESPDISFDRSINPYRGCEHGCVYCFARPSHAYMGMSPGLDFETQAVRQAGRGKAAGARALQAWLRSRRPSPSAPTPTPTSRSSGNGGSRARSSKCSRRRTIRLPS